MSEFEEQKFGECVVDMNTALSRTPVAQTQEQKACPRSGSGIFFSRVTVA